MRSTRYFTIGLILDIDAVDAADAVFSQTAAASRAGLLFRTLHTRQSAVRPCARAAL